MGEERGLARTAPTSEADDAHAGTIAGRRLPGAVQREGNPVGTCLRDFAESNAPDGRPPDASIGCAAGYSAACMRPSGGGALTWPLAISFSAHRLWCCLAQFTSTVPSHIPSKAPSIPTVPI